MSSPHTSSVAGASTAGIITDDKSGERVVPESRRADGSIRKERRVKPGFVPVEDVARFRPSRVLRARAEEKEVATREAGDVASRSGPRARASEPAQKVSDPPSHRIEAPSQRKKGSTSPLPAPGSASSMWATSAPSQEKNTPVQSPSPEWRRNAGKVQPSITGSKDRLHSKQTSAHDGKATSSLVNVSEATKAGMKQSSPRQRQGHTTPHDARKANSEDAATRHASGKSDPSINAIADELATLGIATKQKSSSEGNEQKGTR